MMTADAADALFELKYNATHLDSRMTPEGFDAALNAALIRRTADDTESTERCQRVEPEVGFEHEGPTCVTHNDAWGECRTTPADDTETQQVEAAVYEAAGSRARDFTQLRMAHDEDPVWTVTLAEVPKIIDAALAARAAGDDLAVERAGAPLTPELGGTIASYWRGKVAAEGERIAQAIEERRDEFWAWSKNGIPGNSPWTAMNEAARIARTNPGEGGAE